MSDYPQLDFDDNKDFNAAVLNAAMEVLDTRLRALESQTVSYTDAIDQLNAFGLQRLNDAIQPVYNKLIAIAQIGVIFNATSNTPNALTVGQKTFIIDSARASTFAPAAYLQISSSSDGSMALYGATQTYDASTGTLVVLIDQLRGVSATPITAWNISAAGTPNLITQAHDVGAYSSVETDQAINTAINKIVGAPPASLNTLELIASAVTAFTAGAPSNLKTFTQIATALDNRLRTDVTQGLNSTAVAQALANLGISTVMQSFLSGSGTLSNPLTVNGSVTATGPLAISFPSPYLDLVYGNVLRSRQIIDSSGNWILRNGDNGDNYLYVTTGGAVWTKQFGDLNSRIEARGQAWGQWAVNQCATSMRLPYAGDLYNSWNLNGGMAEPYGGAMISSRATIADGTANGAWIPGIFRWRYVQYYTPNAGWVTAYYA